MKQIYTPLLISGILISSVMLFTSCTKDKETVQSLKAYDETKTTYQGQGATTIKDTPGHQHQVQAANTGNKIYVYKPICCLTYVIGGSYSIPTWSSITCSAEVVIGPDKTKLDASIWAETNGVPEQLGTISSGYPNSGIIGLSITTIARPNSPYWVKIGCGDEHSWVPHLDLNNNECYINFPKSGVTVRASFY